MYKLNKLPEYLIPYTEMTRFQEAKAGGFVTRIQENGTVVFQNPAAAYIIPMLDTVLGLAR